MTRPRKMTDEQDFMSRDAYSPFNKAMGGVQDAEGYWYAPHDYVDPEGYVVTMASGHPKRRPIAYLAGLLQVPHSWQSHVESWVAGRVAKESESRALCEQIGTPMVRRVALALNPEGLFPSHRPELQWEWTAWRYRSAIDAIKAMREPTEAMVEAAEPAIMNCHPEGVAVSTAALNAWRAAIDEALKP